MCVRYSFDSAFSGLAAVLSILSTGIAFTLSFIVKGKSSIDVNESPSSPP